MADFYDGWLLRWLTFTIADFYDGWLLRWLTFTVPDFYRARLFQWLSGWLLHWLTSTMAFEHISPDLTIFNIYFQNFRSDAEVNENNNNKSSASSFVSKRVKMVPSHRKSSSPKQLRERSLIKVNVFPFEGIIKWILGWHTFTMADFNDGWL